MRTIWSWLQEWVPYSIPAVVNMLLIVLGLVMSLPRLAEKIEDTPKYRKWLSFICIVTGLVGFYCDVRARHDSDKSTKQLTDNTSGLVTDTKNLILTRKMLVYNTNNMVTGLSDTMKRVRGMSASLQQTRSILANEVEFFNHMDLRVVSGKSFAKKAQQLSSTVNDLAFEYNWKINTGAGQSYWDHVEGGRSTPEELAQLKRDMEKSQVEFQKEYQKEAAKIMVQVGPICEELVRRLDPSDRTEQDKQWAIKFATRPTDATDDMQGLGQYLQELSTRVLQTESVTVR